MLFGLYYSMLDYYWVRLAILAEPLKVQKAGLWIYATHRIENKIQKKKQTKSEETFLQIGKYFPI